MAEKQSFIEEVTTGLPAWAKGIIAVGVIGGIGYGIYRLSKKGASILNPSDAKQDVKKLKEAGQQPTYMDAQYLGFADAIYAARGCNNLFGTNEDAIYAVFRKMANDIDVAKLIEKYGERYPCWAFKKSTLGGLLSEDLNEKEIAIINDILKKKGIIYQF